MVEVEVEVGMELNVLRVVRGKFTAWLFHIFKMAMVMDGCGRGWIIRFFIQNGAADDG